MMVPRAALGNRKDLFIDALFYNTGILFINTLKSLTNKL
jgi:hypothetical protein